MPIAKRLLLLAAPGLLLPILAGCLPSDAGIEDELAAGRRQAYLEWKNRRERGGEGETRVDGPLSLDDAVRVALQYNKALQAALQDREITRGNRISAYAVVFPTFGLSGGNGHAEGGRGGYLDNYSAGLSVRQPIFDAAMSPKLLSARLSTALTDERIRGQVQDLIAQVANTYYDVLLAQRLVDTHREALTSAETQFRMVSEKKRQETATEYDVLRAQVDVATYRASMQTEINNIDTNRVALLKLMGASQDSQVAFSDQLEFIPMRPVIERAVEIASGLRPDLRTSELTYRLEQEAVRLARSNFLPGLAGTFEQNWSEGANSAFGRNPWSFRLGASLDFGIDDYGGLVAARARARQSQIQILDTQETAVKEIRQYMNSLANAEETVKALEVNQDAAREALRLALVGYQAGVKTEVDVTDARKALTEVIGRYYQALANHTKARLNLQVAMGVLGPVRIDDNMPSPPGVPIANIAEFAVADYVPPEPFARPPPAPETGPAPAAGPPAGEPAPPASRRRAAAPPPPSESLPAAAGAAGRPPEMIPAPPGGNNGRAAAGAGRTGEGRPEAPAGGIASRVPPPPPPGGGLRLPVPPEIAASPEAPGPVAAGLPERPLFRVSIRTSAGASPEMARADR
ncbi:MAG: TolC family protein [Planctomycetota bacterium]|nr:TolC family protein [Planctomycetota bacterium]